MDQTRWRIVTEIFHDAIELAPGERGKYVSEASGGDQAIESEVIRLLRADSDATTFLEQPITQFPSLNQPASSNSPFAPGDVLKDRYEILRLVGEGGMGYVLEALDLELNVPVAVKVIRPEIAIHAQMLELFRREVRTARSITHRNVCRTYDLDKGTVNSHGERKEFLFLTMEFLAGETLADRLIRTGPLPLPEAFDILHQIADGLDCSHRAGVIHRDIKPGNIMLVPEAEGTPRAVIMDFGLARIDPRYQFSQAPSLSGLVGTLAYMAPEQMRPEATVSSATDVYAFGLVILETVIGRSVLDLNAPRSKESERGDLSPEPETSDPRLPSSWELAIEGCLFTDPRQRSQSAGEVIRAIETNQVAEQKLSMPVLPLSENAAARRRFRQIAWLGNALVLLVLSLFLAWLRFHKQEIESRIGPGTYLYVMPLKNETGIHEFDGIGELLRTALSQSAQFNLLSQSRIGDTLEMMSRPPDSVITEPIAREIALRAGAERLVFTNIRGFGDTYQLDVEIQQPDNTPSHYRKHWLKSFEWKRTRPEGNAGSARAIPSELLDQVRDASDWIRQKVGESQNDIARLNAPVNDVTTSDWDALGEYSNAMHAQQERKTDDAIRFLNHAVEIDPGFALAYARLGDLENDLDRFKEGIAAYQKALVVSTDKRLTRRERDRIRGQFAMDSSDFQTAEDAFRDYTLFYSNDFRGYFYQGYPLMMLGRFDESEAALRRSIELNGTELSPQIQLACLYMVLGDLPRAHNLAERQFAMGRIGDANKILGETSFLESDFVQSQKYFESMQNSSDPFAKVMSFSLLARLSAEQGQYDRSLEYLGQTTQIAREQGDRVEEASALLDRAYLHMRLGDYEEAFEETKSAMELDRSLQRIATASSILSSSILRTSGSKAAEMRKVLADLDRRIQPSDAIVLSNIVKHRVHGELLLADRQWKQAVDEMHTAAALDAPINPKEYFARALADAATHDSDPAVAQAFRNQSIATYEASTKSPGVIWSIARQYPPGYLADQMVALFSLTGKNSQGIGRLIPQWRRLSALRGASSDVLRKPTARTP